MGKRLVGKVVALVAVACLAVPFVSCTATGGGSGGGSAAKSEMGGKYECACGIPKTVGPGEPAPQHCGKPMKRVGQ